MHGDIVPWMLLVVFLCLHRGLLALGNYRSRWWIFYLPWLNGSFIYRFLYSFGVFSEYWLRAAYFTNLSKMVCSKGWGLRRYLLVLNPGWRGEKGEMMWVIHRRHKRNEGNLPLYSFTELWLILRIISRKIELIRTTGSLPALVSSLLVVEQRLSVYAGSCNTEMMPEGKDIGLDSNPWLASVFYRSQSGGKE